MNHRAQYALGLTAGAVVGLALAAGAVAVVGAALAASAATLWWRSR